jgi:uncharacterized membrane protein
MATTHWNARASMDTRGEQETRREANGTLSRGLGWFSIGLGLAEVLAPKQVARLIGTRNHTGWIQAFGVREIVAGVGILTNGNRAPWVWARVGGDVLDMAALGAALTSSDTERARTIASVAAVAGVTALDVFAAKKESGAASLTAGSRAQATTLVNKSPDECYRFWRNFEQLPQFMSYLEAVRTTGDRESHWVATAPGGVRMEWDAELVEDEPGRKISWRALPGGNIDTSGVVTFEEAPGGRGCQIKVKMRFGGAAEMLAPLGRLIGKHPEQMIDKDLRRFRQVMETGEALTTDGQSAGRSEGSTWLDSIAR